MNTYTKTLSELNKQNQDLKLELYDLEKQIGHKLVTEENNGTEAELKTEYLSVSTLLNEKKSNLSVDFLLKMNIIDYERKGLTMLIQFNFKNFKSFREEATLDLSAAKMAEFSDRVVTIGSEKILPVAAIYGANASGKSNIYNAFEYMSDYVAESFRYGGEEEKFEQFRPTPFLFDSTSADAESSFEVYFTLPGDKAEKTYNYGFCINNSCSLAG